MLKAPFTRRMPGRWMLSCPFRARSTPVLPTSLHQLEVQHDPPTLLCRLHIAKRFDERRAIAEKGNISCMKVNAIGF